MYVLGQVLNKFLGETFLVRIWQRCILTEYLESQETNLPLYSEFHCESKHDIHFTSIQSYNNSNIQERI